MQSWSELTRAHFELTPPELATLVAVVAFVDVEGRAMPREELDRVAGQEGTDSVFRVDATTPGRLARLGLLKLHGYRDGRSYTPTTAGLRKARALDRKARPDARKPRPRPSTATMAVVVAGTRVCRAPFGFGAHYAQIWRDPAPPDVLRDMLELVGWTADPAAIAAWSMVKRVEAQAYAARARLRETALHKVRVPQRPGWMGEPWQGESGGPHTVLP